MKVYYQDNFIGEFSSLRKFITQYYYTYNDHKSFLKDLDLDKKLSVSKILSYKLEVESILQEILEWREYYSNNKFIWAEYNIEE